MHFVHGCNNTVMNYMIVVYHGLIKFVIHSKSRRKFDLSPEFEVKGKGSHIIAIFRPDTPVSEPWELINETCVAD